MRKIAVLTALVLALAAGQADARGVGTSAANFLKVGKAARAAGMGNAFVAIADDINALEYNPAGLSTLEPDHFDASFEHIFWLGDVEYEVLSYAQLLGETYGGGLQLMYRHMPDIDNDLEDEQSQKVFDFAGQVGYGLQLSNFSVGVNLKVIMSRLGPVDLVGEAADAGALLTFMEKKFAIGLALKNLGPDIQTDSLPLTILGGLAYMETFGEMREHNLNLSFQIDQPLDNKLTLELGAEYWFMKTFGARLGYKQQLGANDLQSDNLAQRLTAGASIRWADMQIDYAFVPYADLGATHRISLNVHYGPLSDDVKKF